ncbi:MAG: hypothetical protein HQM09_23360 [Candidatus Riflebacteria bacterium]|nr:hypothetical protein [Candidatus Riflebacteria bacterium]
MIVRSRELLEQRLELVARAYCEQNESTDAGRIWLELINPINGADEAENQADRVIIEAWRHRPSRIIEFVESASSRMISPETALEDLADSLVAECCAGGGRSASVLTATDEQLKMIESSLGKLPKRQDVDRYLETEILLRWERLNSNINRSVGRHDLPNPAFVAVKQPAGGTPLIGGFIAAPENVVQLITGKARTVAGTRFQDAMSEAAKSLSDAYRSYSSISLIEPMTDIFRIPIDGASVGLAAWIFGWLRFRRLDLPFLLAASGHVVGGKVLGVDPGTIDQKISAALATGYARFLAPRKNKNDSTKWKADPRVVWIESVEEIIEWFASQSIWNARRDLEMHLTRKTLLPREAALEGLDRLFRENLSRDRPFSLIRDLRATLRESVARCRVSLFKNVMDRLRLIYLNRLEEWLNDKVSNEEWLSLLRHMVSPEIFFFHLPFLLKSLHERGDSGLRERLAGEMLHRVLDHDVDAALALINGRGFFDPLSVTSNSIFRDTAFREALPHLLWIALDEPSRAIRVLTTLPKLFPFEEEWLRIWLQILARIDTEKYARAGVLEYRSFLEPVMIEVLGPIYPGFRPGLANPCSYPERLANLWHAAMLLRERFGTEVALPVEQHFLAHLRAPKPTTRTDIPAALADYPEFPELIAIDMHTDLTALICARKKLGTPRLVKRPILRPLCTAIDAEIGRRQILITPPNNDSEENETPKAGSPSGWPREIANLFERDKILSDKKKQIDRMHSADRNKEHDIFSRSEWMRQLSKAVCDMVNGTIQSDTRPSLRIHMFIQPAQLLANLHLADTADLRHFFDLLQGWCEGHKGGRLLAAQCLAYHAVRMALTAGKTVPRVSNVGKSFHLAVTAALVAGKAGFGASGPDNWLKAAIRQIATAAPHELLWLLWISPNDLPELKSAVEERATSLCASLENPNPDYDRSQAKTGLFILGTSPWYDLLPDITAAKAGESLQELLRQYRKNPDLSRSIIQICAPWYFLRIGRWKELVRLFKKTIHRTTSSTFTVMYAALILCKPNLRRDRHLHLDHGGLGSPQLWASSLEREMFETIRLLETFTQNDRRLMRRLFLWKIQEPSNLFLASRLLEGMNDGNS